jgi:hypothetical protein
MSLIEADQSGRLKMTARLKSGQLWACSRRSQVLYGSPEISGRECRFDLGHIIGATYKAGGAGAQATAQSERIRPWLVANRFQAISQASMMSAKLINTELASQWLRR